MRANDWVPRSWEKIFWMAPSRRMEHRLHSNYTMMTLAVCSDCTAVMTDNLSHL